MLWRSVVGKLWMTILLLVSFVLGFVAILLSQFFRTYYVDLSETRLTKVAQSVTELVEEGADVKTIENIAYKFSDPLSRIIIVKDGKEFSASPKQEGLVTLTIDDLKADKELAAVFINQKENKNKIRQFPDGKTKQSSENDIMIVGKPLKGTKNSAVFVYESLQVPIKGMEKATDFIFLSAGIAIILTTFFAFFLSTRITAPLRKMREVAFEVARGKFDAKVPMVSQDEIGELATALNQMGKQLKFNMNALQQEKEQLSSILSSMADGVITLNQEGEVVVINPPAEHFLQVWQEENDLELSRNLPPELVEQFHFVAESEQQQVIEMNLQKGNYVVLMTPLYNQTKIRGAVAVLRDMTEERRLEKMRKDFIANVSHELRTPMVMLQGYSEAILDDVVQTKEEINEFVQIIYDESVRLGRLVNELLDLARMESGHVELHMSEVEIHPFVEKIGRKFQGIAQDKGVKLTVDFRTEVTEHTFDPDRLEQVLTNLIDNAIRHTSADGHVKLVIDKKDAGIVFEVQDTGAGIPEEDIPFLFDRFYKADKARTRGKTGGTGLGLAIAKNIVQSHDGKISVSSVVGEGTTFFVYLPNHAL
ncbi:ATP-binding protein [Bacillus cytotoxicus]|uniref:histidine kinase n=2 Tax=Bacillus cytotoxicus TaxID=580165 RepID=A0AAX2CEP6_9BACI|nr:MULTISPECIES: ATP-binding protein [Bacillus cereus group]ABS21523.1 multi-sensor signal transduction histidine kinase [Bacillus cytotoxicus NVH 391-98]AWC28165.1 histidine kinase [Bacillus cytotoxicus]AWC32194.1 histidine kinase [Bacillus cytotoxicus]AWC36223.1 histidine kinase [Bacillus cytotoxicus]AWC40450.1 histidine kinase [Bacillus cytotoxicus]